jgi:hypothetical protein
MLLIRQPAQVVNQLVTLDAFAGGKTNEEVVEWVLSQTGDITLNHITLRYVTLHYVTLHYLLFYFCSIITSSQLTASRSS